MRTLAYALGLLLLTGAANQPVKTTPAAGQTSAATPPTAPTPLSVFDDTTKLVTEHFYDRTMRGLPWPSLVAEARKALEAKPNDERLQATLGQLLSELKASHTQILAAEDQEYWALQSIFSGQLEGARVRHLGAWFERRGAKWFVRNVLPGYPAAEAGLVRGDEVLTVDGKPFAPLAPLSALKPNEKVRLAVKSVAWDKPRDVLVGTVMESYQESFFKAMRRSRRVFEQKDGRVAYVWLPSGTHAAFREELADAAKQAEKNADALVLDLRDGFGGADLAFLDPFFETLGKDGVVQKPMFTKKLVTLVNGGTRSGKEWLAWFIKKHERGPLVGERTAGSFLAGRLFDVAPGRYALYLAVADTKGLGVSLEGTGVPPHQAVESPLMYAAGADPALTAALQEATKK